VPLRHAAHPHPLEKCSDRSFRVSGSGKATSNANFELVAGLTALYVGVTSLAMAPRPCQSTMQSSN